MSEQDDRIEALLRTRRIQPTPDEGFSARVMGQLPSRGRRDHRWIVPVLSGIGALLAALILPREQLSSAIADLAQPQVFSALALTVTALVWIGSAWVLIDRRYRAL
jgi:hypothetical protein